MVYPFICSIVENLGCLYLTFVGTMLWTLISASIWVLAFNFGGTCLKIGLLHRIVMLCLSEKPPRRFPQGLHHFTCLPARPQGSNFSSTCYFPLLQPISYLPDGCVKQRLSIVVLMCISLVTSDVEYLFILPGHLYIFFGEMSFRSPLSIFFFM